jgi:hypothetical protein
MEQTSERHWEAFNPLEHRGRRSPRSIAVTLQQLGVFTFNLATYVALGEPPTIHLAFAPDERIIAFVPSTNEDKGAYPVLKMPKSATYFISGRAFCRHFGIIPDMSRCYPAYMEDGRLLIDLKQDAPVVRGPRSRQASVQA